MTQQVTFLFRRQNLFCNRPIKLHISYRRLRHLKRQNVTQGLRLQHRDKTQSKQSPSLPFLDTAQVLLSLRKGFALIQTF